MKRKPPFLTILPDGLEVPWKPLTVGEYLKLISDPYLSFDELEDIIFSKCVLDEYLVNKIDTIKAGIIPTVVSGILANSVPNNLQESQMLLDYYRVQVDKNYLEELVLTILLAFPAYKPEDVYELDLQDLMYRLALAERKLLITGMLQKPFNLFDPEKAKKANKSKPKMDPHDFKKQWEKSQRWSEIRPGFSEMPDYSPPVPEYAGEKTVIRKEDTPPAELVTSGTETDAGLLQEKMVRETIPFYSDYLEMVKKGDKITPEKIKSPAQREKEAKERVEVSKKELAKQLAQQRKKETQEQKRINSLFEKGLTKKQKKKISKK